MRSPQGLRALGGREGAQGGALGKSVSFGVLGTFPGRGVGVFPSSQEGIPLPSLPPLCWEHYTHVGGNDNVELNEN